MKKTVIIFLILISSIEALVAKERFIYTQISRNEGLTSTVNSIYKERNGDIWLGTPNGLYRFNGYDLRHYDDSLFKGRRIFQISEDSKGSIWILSDNWIMRRNEDEVFSEIRAEGFEGKHPFHSMCQDEEGIWLGGNGKIFRYSYERDALEVFADLNERSSFICRYIGKADERTLICCSHNGIILIDTETGEVSDAPYGSHKEVSATLIDSRGHIWIAFYNNGIRVFDNEGKPVRSYQTSNSELSNDVVLCLTERNGEIWAGTDGGGINIINPQTGKITVLSHISGDQSSFPAHSIKSLHTDHYGNIWAGSIRDGLIGISRSGMKTYTDSHIGLKSGLSNPTVLCLYQDDSSDSIWIGTDGEGLNRFDPLTNEFTHYPATLKTKIVSIAAYSETELALSVYADRIWIFNKITGKMRPLTIKDKDIDYLMRYAGRSLNIADRSDGGLLLISNTVSLLDKATGLCSKIETEGNIKAEGNFSIIGTDKKGLWLHDYHSIYLLPEGKDALENIGNIGSHTINSGYLGEDDDIWLATDNGLCRFSIAGTAFSFIETSLFDEAMAVVYDGNSRVWVGTDSHLFAYLTDSEGFAMFGESDGASPNEYLSKPRLQSHRGDVYIGGVQGLLCIDSDFSIDAAEEPAVRLYSLTADKEKVTADRDGIYEIPRSSKLLSISISTQETDIFRQKMYRFSILGSGRIYEVLSPELEIRELPEPGKYDVLVSCTKRNGEWTEPARIMTIRIPRPWYLSGWFIAGIAAFILLTSGSIVIGYMNRKAGRLQLALKEQEQKVYEEKVRMLINISHELRTPLTLIMAPLKRLLNGNASEQEQTATLQRIYRKSKRMKSLLDMVLDLRKLEVGGSGVKIEKADFNSWLYNAVEDIISEEKAEGITVSTELDPAIGMVDFDRKKCETVLMNILMNAIKHSSKGDHIRISTGLQENGNVRISISDEGPGLGEIDRSKLFTRFYQSNSEEYGSGIGLSYSKILVELQGGQIGAENNEVKGATFWWEIPTSSEKAADIQPKAYLNEVMDYNPADEFNMPENERTATSGIRLMIVDDSQDLLDFLKEALTGEFAEIITATGGNKALSVIRGGKLPDIIISDVNMPDGDGYRLCAELKGNERYSHIPIVLLTARGEEQSLSDSYKAGADAFMSKPFEIETLMELIRSMLRKRNEIRKKYLDNDGKAVADYGSNEESFIIRLNKIISEHLDNPDLDQQLLCREMGLSRASLFNKMKSITGSGAKEYITKIRLEKAKSLIENTNMTIAEVSERTGFASQSYFSTAFKSYTGLTPSQYKQQYKKN